MLLRWKFPKCCAGDILHNQLLLYNIIIPHTLRISIEMRKMVGWKITSDKISKTLQLPPFPQKHLFTTPPSTTTSESSNAFSRISANVSSHTQKHKKTAPDAPRVKHSQRTSANTKKTPTAKNIRRMMMMMMMERQRGGGVRLIETRKTPSLRVVVARSAL